MAVLEDTVTEGLGLAGVEAGNLITQETASDDLGITYQLIPIYQQTAVATETLGLQPVADGIRGVVLIEALRLSSTVTPNEITNQTLTEALGLLDQLLPGLPVTVTESLALSITETIQQVTEIVEELGLEPVLTGAALYNISCAEGLGLADSLANFFGGEITESLAFSPTLTGNMLMQHEQVETLGLEAVETANLVLRVDVEEELGLEGVELLNAIYNGTITEELALTAAYISPGGGFTTWSMNTRTAAVTEYDNYEFNSFARLGDKYIGATANGLYELIGDDDAGDNIIATIKSGFMQWAGSRFTIFKAAYLGVRGEGDFVLRLTTGDDKTYDYAVSTRNMRSTKVHMGKGLRSHYFRFELISDGQDFDLESIEFVPLVTERRV